MPQNIITILKLVRLTAYINLIINFRALLHCGSDKHIIHGWSTCSEKSQWEALSKILFMMLLPQKVSEVWDGSFTVLWLCNRRIIEWFGLEKTSRSSSSTTPSYGQGHLSLDHGLRYQSSVIMDWRKRVYQLWFYSDFSEMWGYSHNLHKLVFELDKVFGFDCVIKGNKDMIVKGKDDVFCISSRHIIE